MVDPVAQRPVQDLLRVGDQQGFGLVPKGGHGARQERGLEPVVEAGELQRGHAAARLSGDADPRGVHVGARLQIIQRPRRIPNAVLHQVHAQQVALVAQDAVLRRPRPDGGSLLLRSPQLQPFALAERVPSEHDETLPRHQNRELLVRLAGLAAGRMAAGKMRAGSLRQYFWGGKDWP